MSPFEEMYFNWLCAKVLSQDPHVRNYYGLMETLYRTEFVWSIPGDRNRAEDGCELRTYFLNESGMDTDEAWFNMPCSVLEVLIAFAQRASFQTDQPVHDWFMTFMINLGLDDYRRVTDRDYQDIHDKLERFMYRTFEPNGDGGLLPIRNATRDQRRIELWFQLCDYMAELAIF